MFDSSFYDVGGLQMFFTQTPESLLEILFSMGENVNLFILSIPLFHELYS